MTQQEIELVDNLGDCFNAFVKLDQLHQSDNREFEFHIHALQNIVLSREGLRAYYNREENNIPYVPAEDRTR